MFVWCETFPRCLSIGGWTALGYYNYARNHNQQYTQKLNIQHKTSHTHTVVRECCKGDDASQWENGKFDPLPPPNPLTDRHKKLHTWLCHRYLRLTKFSRDPSRDFFSPYARNCASKCLLGFFLGVLPTSYSLDAWTDFHAQYVKRRGSAQGCAFWDRKSVV